MQVKLRLMIYVNELYFPDWSLHISQIVNYGLSTVNLLFKIFPCSS